MTTKVEKSIQVDVPIGTVYNQWTQFADFPQFMGGVQEVVQLDDRRLHWVAEIAGVKREWDAVVLEQVPDQKVAWAATSGATNAGAVIFAPAGTGRTLVTLQSGVRAGGDRREGRRQAQHHRKAGGIRPGEVQGVHRERGLRHGILARFDQRRGHGRCARRPRRCGLPRRRRQGRGLGHSRNRRRRGCRRRCFGGRRPVRVGQRRGDTRRSPRPGLTPAHPPTPACPTALMRWTSGRPRWSPSRRRPRRPRRRPRPPCRRPRRTDSTVRPELSTRRQNRPAAVGSAGDFRTVIWPRPSQPRHAPIPGAGQPPQQAQRRTRRWPCRPP